MDSPNLTADRYLWKTSWTVKSTDKHAEVANDIQDRDFLNKVSVLLFSSINCFIHPL